MEPIEEIEFGVPNEEPLKLRHPLNLIEVGYDNDTTLL